MFIQTQGEQKTKKGPTMICKVKENNNNNHLHRAYSTRTFKMKPVLASSHLIFLTPVGVRYHHLHFTAQIWRSDLRSNLRNLRRTGKGRSQAQVCQPPPQHPHHPTLEF